MTKRSAWKKTSAVFLLCAATAIAAPAQTFNTLVNFDETNGQGPMYLSLIQGRDGELYGTTAGGGINFGGTVFTVTQAGDLTTVYSFCSQTNCSDGEAPYAGLVLGTDGDFYGSTFAGGAGSCCGSVFKLTPSGMLTSLYSFCSQTNCTDGQWPYAPLAQGTGTSFYGTTYMGGVYGSGTAFKVTSEGTFTTLLSFDGDDGIRPSSGLIRATDGNFYGTAIEGGINNMGTVFKITPEGALTTVHNFEGGHEGINPIGGLIQASDGELYGTTSNGGEGTACFYNGGCGTVFKITMKGKLTTLYRFCSQANCTDGADPVAGLVQASDGNFYGTTFYGGDVGCGSSDGCGTVFEITPGGMLTTLHAFCSQTNCPDGVSILGGLLQATDGIFYGTTQQGGAYNYGTVFSLSTGLGPFIALVRNSGKVGQTGGILGQGFTGTTSVSLNGVPATFTVVSDTFINATVPAGATTGYVTVTTPSGTLISNVPFHVIP
jgi:uncharacterized repeat protein (TIGR03803 family)